MTTIAPEALEHRSCGRIIAKLHGDLPELAQPARSSDFSNALFLLTDDVREAAMALAGIEDFLVQAEALLVESKLGPAIERLLSDNDLGERVEVLEENLAALVRSLVRLKAASAPRPAQ